MMGDSFNKYFCTIGETLKSKIDSHDNHAYAAYLPSPVKDSMFCTPVTDEEILRIISVSYTHLTLPTILRV